MPKLTFILTTEEPDTEYNTKTPDKEEEEALVSGILDSCGFPYNFRVTAKLIGRLPVPRDAWVGEEEDRPKPKSNVYGGPIGDGTVDVYIDCECGTLTKISVLKIECVVACSNCGERYAAHRFKLSSEDRYGNILFHQLGKAETI